MAFQIVNRQPTFLTIKLKSTEVVIGPVATKGPFADRELSADVKLKESRGILSVRHIKEEIPREKISKLVKEAEDLQHVKEETGTDVSNKPELKRRKKKNG